MTLVGRFRRYLLTGGFAALVDLGGFVLLRQAGLAVAPAAALGFCLAAVVNYALTTRFVFGIGASRARFAAFLAFAAMGLAINAGVTTLVAAGLPVPDWLAKCAGIGVAFGFNFLVNVFVVFRQRRSG